MPRESPIELKAMDEVMTGNDNFSMEIQNKIDDLNPTSENSLMVPKISGRVTKLRAFRPPELLASNFLAC